MIIVPIKVNFIAMLGGGSLGDMMIWSGDQTMISGTGCAPLPMMLQSNSGKKSKNKGGGPM